MPLVRIDAQEGLSEEVLEGVHQGIQAAFVSEMGFPAGDYFHITTLHKRGELRFDPTFLGAQRENVMFISILLVQGRGREEKKRLLDAVRSNLSDFGLRRDDLFIALVENHREDWAVGGES